MCLPGARQHMKILQKTFCQDSLRGIFVCLFLDSLMLSEAVFASRWVC